MMNKKTSNRETIIEINEEDKVIDFKIYPNPATSSITLEFYLENASVLDISIYDITGREAMNIIHDNYDQGHIQIVVDVSAMPPGYTMLYSRQ